VFGQAKTGQVRADNMHLLYVLLILLVVTRTLSEFAVRLKLPALVGELLGGILLGILIAANVDTAAALADIDQDQTVQAILDLAVFFLMLLAGMEMQPKELANVGRQAFPVAAVGMLMPLTFGLMLGWFFLPESAWKPAQSLFIGVALAVTAVPVAVRVLMDLDLQHSRVGQVIIAAAVMDDVISLVLLAILTAFISSSVNLTATLLATMAAQVAAFFLVAWASGRFLLPQAGRLVKKLDMEHAEFSLLIVYGLALAVLAEILQMHFLIGAFAAGVFFNRSTVGVANYKKVRSQTEALTMGFLAPVFFASIGMHLNVAAIVEIPVFLIFLLVAATAGKLFGAGLVARFSGFTSRQALAIGAAMNARGAVEIIVAGIAFRAGLFSHPDPPTPEVEYLFSAIVILAIVTTLATPIALRVLLADSAKDQ
jgi:Kef-type K+ transport system membrane component KefB